jgi:lysine decarboxylase/arginine decarboxylase
MLDPIKSTIITPGLDVTGKFSQHGIPASIVTKYLAEHGVVVEKTGLYSFFIMFTIGITKGRWNTLLTALQQFKDDYAKNQPMWRILPEFCQKYPRYERMGLADLCQHIHELYAKYDIARLTTEVYLSDLTPAMTPSDAYAHIAHRKTERVEIDQLEGQVVRVGTHTIRFGLGDFLMQFTIAWIVAGAIGIAVASSVLPALRAAGLHPVEALRHE